MNLRRMDEGAINESAKGILSIFDDSTLYDLYVDMYDLFSTFSDDDSTYTLLKRISGDDIQEVRLLHAAILVSRLARKYNKKLKKVQSKYSNFDLDIEEYAKRKGLVRMD